MVSKQLLIISSYLNEPPTGGVTMHVHRMLKVLVEPQVPHFELCDYKEERFGEQLQKIKKADVMHIHASNPFLKLFYILSGKICGTKSLMTIHGRYGILGPLKNLVHKWALKWCDIPILINRESYDDVVKFNSNAVFIPAFIPPIEEEEVLSPEIEKSIRSIKADGKPLFATNASSRAFTDDGREIYGIDFLIDYFSRYLNYNLVILDPKNEYTPLLKDKLSDNIWIFTGNHSFCGLVKMADIVIRNTPTDGDSFSVKEALCLHKPILATDAVSRPEGVFLFKYNDEDSLTKAIEIALSNNEEIVFTEKDATESYYELYKKLGVIPLL